MSDRGNHCPVLAPLSASDSTTIRTRRSHTTPTTVLVRQRVFSGFQMRYALFISLRYYPSLNGVFRLHQFTHPNERFSASGFQISVMTGFPALLNCDTYIFAVISVSATVAVDLWDKRKTRHSYLSGPRGYPLLENYFNWTKGKIWEGFIRRPRSPVSRGDDSLFGFGKLLMHVCRNRCAPPRSFWVAYTRSPWLDTRNYLD